MLRILMILSLLAIPLGTAQAATAKADGYIFQPVSFDPNTGCRFLASVDTSSMRPFSLRIGEKTGTLIGENFSKWVECRAEGLAVIFGPKN